MKNKVLISVLLVIIIGVTTGLVVSYMNLRNANNQIIELTNKVNENKDSVSDVKNEGKVEESNSVSDKNFALDNNKDDIKYLLEGQKIKWYRESLEYDGLKAVVADNEITFFLTEQGIREAYTGQKEVTIFDGMSVKVEGSDIVEAKFLQLGGRITSCLVLVLADGTVKYCPVNLIIERDCQFTTIEGLNDVVGVRGIAVDLGNNKVQDTSIVIKRDGSKELLNEYFK